MNDSEIRHYFHKLRLCKHHSSANTIVVDELGLKHGKSRADIAVINGYLNGYEIKSDQDSLNRLSGQVSHYNMVFDHVTLLVGKRHIDKAQKKIPDWWGIMLCEKGSRGAIRFKSIRRQKLNRDVDPRSVAELLWKSEVTDILQNLNIPPRILKQRRSVLYECLAKNLAINEIRHHVREYLKKRNNWRCPQQPSPYDGWYQPFSM